MAVLSFKELIKITGIPIVVASLCCLAPVILVLVGLSSVAFAASLTDVLYGQYKWLFRIVGLIGLGFSAYFFITRQRGICTIADVKKNSREIINIVSLLLIGGVVGYILFLYVIVEIMGILLGIWGP